MEILSKSEIAREIASFLAESPLNRLDGGSVRFFDEPLMQAADGADPVFLEFKKAVSPGHLTPEEAFELSFGAGSWNGCSVVSIVFPMSEEVRRSNRGRRAEPAREWILQRTYAALLRDELMKRLAALLASRGARFAVPVLEPYFKIWGEGGRIVSNWSERHVAYAAGLGGFGLNGGFISERGMAIVLASFLTDLPLEADQRALSDPFGNCLRHLSGGCGACLRRCPSGSLSEGPRDFAKCREKCYGEDARKLAESCGGMAKNGSGCGLCNVATPCEAANPAKAIRR